MTETCKDGENEKDMKKKKMVKLKSQKGKR